MRKANDIEKVEERQNASLNEMAVVCHKSDGYGIIIEVYSEDHGVIGNKASPAHAHVKSTSGEYLGKFAITNEPPRSAEYVFDCDKKVKLSLAVKHTIVKWGKAKNKEGASGWSSLRIIWRALHP